MTEVEKRELYLANFKKILTGALDSKIFELNFKNVSEKKSGEDIQYILYEALSRGDGMAEFADKIVDAKLKTMKNENSHYTILLSHRPELFHIYVDNRINLILSEIISVN